MKTRWIDSWFAIVLQIGLGYWVASQLSHAEVALLASGLIGWLLGKSEWRVQ